MVLKKRLDHGFNGYGLPLIPRAPRSVRRKGSRKQTVEDSQICAFELLAAVAGKLLQESESSASSNAAEGNDQLFLHKDGLKQELIEEGQALRSDCLDQGSFIESEFIPKFSAEDCNLKSELKEFPLGENDSILERTSNVTSPNFTKKVGLSAGCDVNGEICGSKNAHENFPNKAEGGCSDDGESFGCKIDNEIERQVEATWKPTIDLTAPNTKDPMEICANTHTLVNSQGSVQLPLYSDPVPNASFAKHRDDVKLGSRDDDENSFRCNQSSTKKRAFRPQTRIGYRRIRKMLTTKYWKVAPKLKDYEISNIDRGTKPIYRSRKAIYTLERCQHEAPSKRRKLFDHSSRVMYNQEASSESISNSPKKNIMGAKNASAAFFHRARGLPSSTKGHQASFHSNNSHGVIKLPESHKCVLCSKQRTVMETVTAILGGGLHVGVLLQGKKVREDNRTLLQTGISCSGNLDTLGFTLEPCISPTSPPVKDPPLSVSCEAHQQSPRSPDSPILELGCPNASSDPPPVTNMDNHVESHHELVPAPANVITDGIVPDCKALVAIPPITVEAHAVVPMNQKAKHSELSQRRTRRPFSVSEVEALVEAVEKLGTGRWRDVKMRAFDSANRRTYVDLKRTVMETVTAILGGGLHVGVLLQGKKVREDNRTLLQTGISCSGNLDTLGFTLEPCISPTSPPPCISPTSPPVKDPPLSVSCEAHQQSPRSPDSPILELGCPNASSDPPPVTNMDNHVESHHELVPAPANVITDGIVPDCKALVAIPPITVEAHAVVPMNQKAKHSELSQRRTRRPFSVSEVEALVEAVEKLGTGRWRDVKMRAFDSANRRTYVDLKDKWKTLVHTASISPQQRRGEPVPQELLDRVLAAHGHWSQQQSKQHGKHQAELLKYSEDQVEGVEI
ncbi:unnamed protein product [Ilex paraguariensis]|uniref:Uncharacterized protein n=1 Tax=Ilex paraguariensis TaxID=185542 RepID=A0ABC8QSZ2_9AQUA